jgi:hypothetical protein
MLEGWSICTVANTVVVVSNLSCRIRAPAAVLYLQTRIGISAATEQRGIEMKPDDSLAHDTMNDP